jgi:pimeloyl-ACP methyl ester carboxylesterase
MRMTFQHLLSDLSIAFACAIATLWALQGWIVFARPVAIRTLKQGANCDFSVCKLDLQRPDGAVLRGWCATPTSPTSATRVLIYFGGRREHVSWAPHMASYLPGWTIYSFAYRGFAGSTGLPTDSRIKIDAQSIYFYVRHLHSNRIDRLAIAGRSLGCCPAVWLARDAKPDDLILFSPFDSMSSVIEQFPICRWLSALLRHHLSTSDHARAVSSRTLVLLAEKDSLVPHAISQRLVESFPNRPKVEIVPSTNHKTLPRHEAAQFLIAQHLLI